MKVTLYDHRLHLDEGFARDLGNTEDFKIAVEGRQFRFRIRNTDYLYSLIIYFSKQEADILRNRLNEIETRRQVMLSRKKEVNNE